MFGITETTVHVTAETMTRRHALERSRSVGRPLPGWHVYVMDSEQRVVPPGVVGEIYVAGAGVSLGYLNRRELTSQRFMPDPFTGQPMYRSGDKGRMRPDGKLEHLGRLDSQVKVRGFRIELGEIRTVLLESRGVMAAAVVVNAADPADPATARIDAYVVLTDEAGSAADVRRRAEHILPDYMMPTTITPLQALPLTTNGKLDIARLPAPKQVPATDPAPSSVSGFLSGPAGRVGWHLPRASRPGRRFLRARRKFAVRGEGRRCHAGSRMAADPDTGDLQGPYYPPARRSHGAPGH